MENKKNSNLLGYIITFFIALLFGTGRLWQYLSYKLESEKIQFERQKHDYEILIKSAELYFDLSEAVDSIINLNEKNRLMTDVGENPKLVEFNKEYDSQYHALADRIYSIRKILCSIEKRDSNSFKKLPAPVMDVSPMAPKNMKTEIIRDKYEISTTIVILTITISLYTLLIILLTIYVPKITSKTVLFIKMRTNKQ